MIRFRLVDFRPNFLSLVLSQGDLPWAGSGGSELPTVMQCHCHAHWLERMTAVTVPGSDDHRQRNKSRNKNCALKALN